MRKQRNKDMASSSVKKTQHLESTKENKHLLVAIEKIANNIRQKFKAIKRNEDDKIASLRQRYKPIVEPLTNVITKISRGDDDRTILDNVVKSEKQSKEIDFATQVRSPTGHESIEYYLREHTGPILRPYIKQLIFDKPEVGNKRMDLQFGMRRVGNSFKIGNARISLDKDDIITVNGQTYSVTRGLANLLFLSKPAEDSYTLADWQVYKNIVIATNAHRKDYLPFGNLIKNNSYKYKHIIQYFAPQKVTGEGGSNLLPVTRNAIDFKYWNDANELVERLHLLHSSRTAGHTGLNAEIAAIEEELREEDLIE